MNDRLEYAVFDGRTGAYQKAEHQVNAINTKKADKKSINTSGIDLFENKMYTNSTKIKYRPTFWLSCLCPPVWYVLNFSGNSRIGSGYLGTINVSN
jgi:hypothetical protein